VTAPTDYALGYSDHEAQRLRRQAELGQDILEYGMTRGGLARGMRVLDLGSGVGDVALFAAKFVGPEGFVTGVERWAPSLEIARRRAGEMGVKNVEFVESALENFDAQGPFDAIIGRFILQYLPDRSPLLNRLKRRLKPSGVVIFQEVDNSGAAAVPRSELFDRVNAWIASAFRATGSVYDMGAELPRTFLEAGLPRPQLLSMARAESGPDTPFYDFLADVLRSVLPVLEEHGGPTREEIDIETLADRLRADALSEQRTLYSARIVTAWARTA
jgi:ubiquinone/menaquinone biosynthesis C-methylase UbiE